MVLGNQLIEPNSDHCGFPLRTLDRSVHKLIWLNSVLLMELREYDKF